MAEAAGRRGGGAVVRPRREEAYGRLGPGACARDERGQRWSG